MAIDPYFRVELLEKTPNPQRLIWLSAHQCVCEGAAIDDPTPDETKAGEYAVKHLLLGDRGHWSPLEAPQISFNVIGFNHRTMQQITRHRIGTHYSVQCLSGDAVVTFVDIEGSSSNKLKKTMRELYDVWHNGELAVRTRSDGSKYRRCGKTRIKKMRARSLNEDTNLFTSNHILDVTFSGLNHVYKVTLEDGKELKCTKNHKILTSLGWRTLEQIEVGHMAMVNGQPLPEAKTTYQSKEWLESHFNKGLIPKDVAVMAGCSVEAVKKWAYLHQLTWQQTKWNKGLRYTIEISEEERKRRQEHGRAVTAKRFEAGLMPKGEDHPSWNHDLKPEDRVYSWLWNNRERILQEKGAKCVSCGTENKLHIHHIKTVAKHPELAYEESNLEILCASCHASHHSSLTPRPLRSHPVKIVSIRYEGIEPTYDLVMEAPHHNFVADGIVVHNSMRYTSDRFCEFADSIGVQEYIPGHLNLSASRQKILESLVYLRPVGEYSDRQGKRYSYTPQQRDNDLAFAAHAVQYYARHVEMGFSEEQAAGLLPMDTRQNWVMSFNVRSLCHLFDARSKPNSQLEIRQLCDLVWPHFEEWVPAIAAWYKEHRWLKGRLAP